MAEEMTSAEVRSKLVEALRLDLVGPGTNLGDPQEVLPQAPSRWYLTGFLVPLGAKAEQRTDETADDDLDQAGDSVAARMKMCQRTSQRPGNGIFLPRSAPA